MQDVSLFEALVITIVSMIVVFIVLILISYLIGILKSLGQNQKKELIDSNTLIETQDVEESTKDLSPNHDEELVAVIAAVIASNMGVAIPDIKIQKIRRIDNSIWNNTARSEQMN